MHVCLVHLPVHLSRFSFSDFMADDVCSDTDSDSMADDVCCGTDGPFFWSMLSKNMKKRIQMLCTRSNFDWYFNQRRSQDFFSGRGGPQRGHCFSVRGWGGGGGAGAGVWVFSLLFSFSFLFFGALWGFFGVPGGALEICGGGALILIPLIMVRANNPFFIFIFYFLHQLPHIFTPTMAGKVEVYQIPCLGSQALCYFSRVWISQWIEPCEYIWQPSNVIVYMNCM